MSDEQEILIEPAFKRRLKKKTPNQVGAILECIDQLAADWRHPGLHTHRVQGTDGVYEAYIDQSNRLTFHWDGRVIVLRNHCNHDILNRNP
jgi:hypothetical protein